MKRTALACAALALLSLLLPTIPTYDPWSWLIWGREIGQGALDTRSGPSWKPLPILVTLPAGFLGDLAPDAWVAVARAGALMAIAMAFRVARLLGGGVAGGLIAAGALAASTDFLRFGAVGDSEGLLVALLLVAVELHLTGRSRAALWAGFAACLLRPEAWPFVGVYALWHMRSDRARVKDVAGMVVLGAVLWFGPELWGSGNPLRAGERARNPNPNALSFADFPAWEILKRWYEMLPSPMAPALAAAGIFAIAERDRPLRLLVGAALAWLVLVAVMTEAGFSGNARYLIAPVALSCLAGGVAVGRMVGGRTTYAIAAVVLVGILISSHLGELPDDVRAVRNEVRLQEALADAVDAAGGASSVRRCGAATTGPFMVPELAWQLDVPIRGVGLTPRRPGSVFRAGPPPRAIRGAPAIAVGRTGWREVARAGPWQVMQSCAADAS